MPNNRSNTILTTNNQNDYQVEIGLHVITFEELWRNYPIGDPCDQKNNDGSLSYKNQCAIRVGLALQKCGVSFKLFRGGVCSGHKGIEEKHILRVEELKDWLDKLTLANWPKGLSINNSNFS